MFHLTELNMIQLRMYGSESHEADGQTFIIQNSIPKLLTRGQKN